MAEQEKLKKVGIECLRELLAQAKELRRFSGLDVGSASDHELEEWISILSETTQVIEQELERRVHGGDN